MVRRSLDWVFLALSLVVVVVSFRGASAAQDQDDDAIIRGAMLYDRWYTVLEQDAPEGDMPLWETQTTNTASGPDTWRCVSCHGWDYQGRDGAYRYGANYTGFPGVYHARDKSPDEIVASLQGQGNPQHDFSQYMNEASMNDLAIFITQALIDDNEYIDPQTLEIKGGDAQHGKQLYTQSCAECHGEDGKKIEFRFEGRQAWLGTLAQLDPWRFLHKTRFGTPGTAMTIGYKLGWTPQDGRDVLLYARSFPNNLEFVVPPPSMEGEEASNQDLGGPAKSIFGGVLTALGAVATALGFAVMIGGLLVGIIFLVVWLVRGQNK